MGLPNTCAFAWFLRYFFLANTYAFGVLHGIPNTFHTHSTHIPHTFAFGALSVANTYAFVESCHQTHTRLGVFSHISTKHTRVCSKTLLSSPPTTLIHQSQPATHERIEAYFLLFLQQGSVLCFPNNFDIDVRQSWVLRSRYRKRT